LSVVWRSSARVAVSASQHEEEDSVNRAALSRSAFPLTAKYDPQWVRENALGENVLCQVESLARRLPLRAGMRVLDLGCGKAASSLVGERLALLTSVAGNSMFA
jgi:cyclopropane fatty-acyl-phospholipid synthase-like methyltransferase